MALSCDCFVGRSVAENLLIFPDIVPLPLSPPLPTLLPLEEGQTTISPHVQKKKRAPRKPRVSKRKLAIAEGEDEEAHKGKVVETKDGEGYVFVDDPVSVKGGKPSKQKKRSKVRVCENTVAGEEVSSKSLPKESKGVMGEKTKETPAHNLHFLGQLTEESARRVNRRFVFCRRNQLQWHIQRVVTQIVNDTCVGCKNSCNTDHSFCYKSPAYILGMYPETCARVLLEKDAEGVASCDKQFLEQIAMYDVKKESAVRLPSSILVSYFASLYPDAPWIVDVLKPFLSFPAMEYAFPPPRFDTQNSKEVIAEVMLGVLSFSPCFSFFFK